MRPPSGTLMCKLTALPKGKSKGMRFAFDKGDAQEHYFEILLWHQKGGIFAFENSCPHLGTPLETFPDRFLNTKGTAHLLYTWCAV